MTIASDENRSGPYLGNGVTTVFDYEFRIFDEAHIRVVHADAVGTETELALGADYSVSGVGASGGGSITVTSAPAVDETITILRHAPFTQETDLENQGAFFAETIEQALDLAVMRDQQLSERIDRAILVPASAPDYDPDQLINNIINLSADRAATEAARDAAAASASALGNQAHQYDTRTLAAAAIIPAGIQAIHTFGLAVVGDGGGRTYVRGTAGGPGAFLGTGGQYWQIASDIGATYNNPIFTGTTSAPTPAPNDATTKIATTEYVQEALTKSKATVYGGMPMEAYGDSITVGSAASNVNTTSWAPLFASANGLNLSRYAVSGVGSVHQLGRAYVNMAQFNRQSLATWMAYHNDVYRGGSSAATIAKIKGALRGFLANCFLKLAYPANHPTQIGRTGTWTEGGAIQEKAPTLNDGAGRLLYCSTVNNTLYWVFEGDNCVVGLFNASGTPHHVGVCTVSVDGATSGPGFRTFSGDGKSDGISDGVYDNIITQDVVILTGLGPGAHTVTVKVTVADAGHPIYVDYFGTLQLPTASSPVIIAEAPRPAAAGYISIPGAWSDAAFDVADAAMYSVVAEFTDIGFPVAVAKVNNFLDRVAGISGDNEHPNDLGHSQIAAAFQDVVTVQRATWLPSRCTDLKKNAAQSLSTAVNVPVTWQTIISDDDGLFSASAPTRITARRACTIQVEGYLSFAASATGIREVVITKNGASGILVSSQAGVTGDSTVIQFFDKRVMANGDYIEINAVQNTGGELNLNADSFISATVVR